MDKQQINLDSIKNHIGGFLKSGSKQLKEGIIDNNPILVQLLGTCPTLATSTSVVNAVGMGIATTSVLVFSNLLISLLRRFIPKQVRIAAFIIVISGFVSAVELLIKAYFPALDRSLGVFIPLIVVNCIILARAEMFASKNGPLPSVIDGLSMGLGFMFGLILLASIRELIGGGTLFGYPVLGENYKPALLFLMPPGAFITLGFLIAFMQKMKSIKSKNKKVLSDTNHAESDNENTEAKIRRNAETKLKTETKNSKKAEVKKKTDTKTDKKTDKKTDTKADTKTDTKTESQMNEKKTEQDAVLNNKIDMIKDAILQAKNELELNNNVSESIIKITDKKTSEIEKTEDDLKNKEKDVGGGNSK